MSDYLIIIPTYNEKENVVNIVPTVLNLDSRFHVLVVDDNSPDGTADEVRKMQNEFNGRLFLEVRSGKSGLGTAYLHGFKWALERQYELIVEMDADFSHRPEDLLKLIAEAEKKEADVIVGSRYVRGGKVENWPLNRLILSFGASIYVRMITWMWVKDPTAGFVCYRKKVLEALDLDNIEFIGYAFQIEMKFKSRLLGFKIVEVPITFVERKVGDSKMSSGIIKEAVFGVIKLKWDSLRNPKPLANKA